MVKSKVNSSHSKTRCFCYSSHLAQIKVRISDFVFFSIYIPFTVSNVEPLLRSSPLPDHDSDNASSIGQWPNIKTRLGVNDDPSYR